MEDKSETSSRSGNGLQHVDETQRIESNEKAPEHEHAILDDKLGIEEEGNSLSTGNSSTVPGSNPSGGRSLEDGTYAGVQSKDTEVDMHPEVVLHFDEHVLSEVGPSTSQDPGVTTEGRSNSSNTQTSDQSNLTRVGSSLPTFDEMLNSIAGNIAKQIRPSPPSFLDDLVESLGSNASYSPGETEEVKEERMRLNETQRMLKELTSDSDLMQQVMRAAANPEMAKELARQADTAWRNIEALPGGFRALCQMHRNIQQPLWQAVTNGGSSGSSSSSRYANTRAPKPTEPLTVEPLPNPWVSQPNPFRSNSGFNPGSLRSLLQTFRGIGEPSTSTSTSLRSSANSTTQISGSSPASTIAMRLFQSHMQNTESSETAVSDNPSREDATGKSEAVVAATAPSQPAGEDTPERFARELQELEEMGIRDRDRCLTALQASDGDLFQALELLQNLEEMDKPETEAEE